MYRAVRFVPVVLLAGGLLWVAGCGGKSDDSKKTADDKAAATDSPKKTDDKATPHGKTDKGSKEADDHGHKSGKHGGIIVSLGRDSYHVEAVFEKGGTVRLHMLGKEETRVQEVENQTLKGFARAEGASESIEFELKPSPQDGDAKGMTSQFVGKLPAELVGKKVEITVPSIRIGSERFRIGFSSAVSHADDLGPALEGDAARTLYLTAGGLYTTEDIAKNGKQTAAQKYKGFRAKHDFKPKAGDYICPITETKANPECTWIVGGKTYQFCCPPCIDEFVALAKERPSEIKEPTDYVKKK